MKYNISLFNFKLNKLTSYYFILFYFLIHNSISYASEQLEIDLNNSKITVQSNFQTADLSEGTFSAKGSVETILTENDIKVLSDNLTFEKSQNTLVFEGNVSFSRTNQEIIEAENLKYFIDSDRLLIKSDSARQVFTRFLIN